MAIDTLLKRGGFQVTLNWNAPVGPDGMFTQRAGGPGAVEKTLFPLGFGAARLICVVESQAAWMDI